MNKSVMNHEFSKVPTANIERSTFNRTHGHKTTFDAGLLIPFLVDEVLPGDTFTVNASIFARLATPIFPLMDNANMDTHFFAVPNRLIWDNWEKFNGAQDDPEDSVDFLIPEIDSFEVRTNSLADYFGLPVSVTGASVIVNALHFRAYNLIYNEWYRDQNLQDSVIVNRDDGPDNINDYSVLRRGKRHDYFTSCLPWPQKGDAISLPTIGDSDILTTLTSVGLPTFTGGLNNENSHMFVGSSGAFTSVLTLENLEEAPGTVSFGSDIGIEASSTIDHNAGGTINDLRRAFQLQKMLERDARGGTRYTEIIKAHFNVTSPDSRLQRPEYLGGGSARVIVNPVEQTSSTDDTTPQANLAAIGTVSSGRNGFSKSFTEHCVIIGIVSVRADLTYQQGINRMWSRRTRYDYFWPALAHIGEQAVLNKEIYYDDTDQDDDVFGYQERYAEYRYKPSLISGLFRSSHSNNLDSWHLSQNFSQLPTLGANFIEERPPFDRVIAVPSEPHFIFDSYISMKCTRPMPLYGTPGMMDRF